MNNNLIIEREDGKLVFAPYSVDISAGQEWYPAPPLLGQSTIARGCQADPVCWQATVATCEGLIDAFDALDPERIVEETVSTLTAEGMMRAGDEARAAELSAWFAARQTNLSAELERFRYLPDEFGVCPNDLVVCNDQGCGTPEDCSTRLCSPDFQWCEATQSCLLPSEPCVTCEPELPFYCPVVPACVTGVEDCTAHCQAILGPGYVFCPAFGYCERPEWCVGNEPEPFPPVEPVDPDGGVFPGGDGGVFAASL
jgi:hypothetical protein